MAEKTEKGTLPPSNRGILVEIGVKNGFIDPDQYNSEKGFVVGRFPESTGARRPMENGETLLKILNEDGNSVGRGVPRRAFRVCPTSKGWNITNFSQKPFNLGYGSRVEKTLNPDGVIFIKYDDAKDVWVNLGNKLRVCLKLIDQKLGKNPTVGCEVIRLFASKEGVKSSPAISLYQASSLQPV